MNHNKEDKESEELKDTKRMSLRFSTPNLKISMALIKRKLFTFKR